MRDRPGYTGQYPDPVYDSNGYLKEYINQDGELDVPTPGKDTGVYAGITEIG